MIDAFHPAAEHEHLASVDYYETRQPGLGTSYLTDFDITIRRLCEAHSSHPVELPPDVQRAQLRRFPYSILFREVEGTIHVLAIAHNRRRPED